MSRSRNRVIVAMPVTSTRRLLSLFSDQSKRNPLGLPVVLRVAQFTEPDLTNL